MKRRFPFRLGSTSYVYPDKILPNVRQLAPLVDDVELVLFEVEDQSNLPSPAVIAELNALATAHNLSYTVHVPLDLRLASGDDVWRSPSMDKARRVIRAVRPLNPWAYVVHLDGTEIASGADPSKLARWRGQATESLEMIGRETGDPRLVAVENLETYAPAAFLSLLDQLQVNLCVDVGHYLKDGDDPLPYLLAHLDRTRVIHLHGSRDGRDHRGLDLLPDGLLGELLDLLLAAPYRGVLTLEVFTERHFFPGRELVLSLMETRA